MADGEIRFAVDIDDKAASRELNRLKSKIEKLETSIGKGQTTQSALAQSLREAQKEAVAACNEVERLEKALSESQRITSVDNNESVDPLTFGAELERQKEITAELERQRTIQKAKEAECVKLEAQEGKVLQKLEEQTHQLHEAAEAAEAVAAGRQSRWSW